MSDGAPSMHNFSDVISVLVTIIRNGNFASGLSRKAEKLVSRGEQSAFERLPPFDQA